jgi:hypothetical protein
MVALIRNADAVPGRPRPKSSPQDRQADFVLEAEVRADPAGSPTGDHDRMTAAAALPVQGCGRVEPVTHLPGKLDLLKLQ